MSDAQVVVSWINGEGVGNINYVNWIYDIRQCILLNKFISVKFTPRGTNALADSLAKEGAGSSGERVEWGV